MDISEKELEDFLIVDNQIELRSRGLNCFWQDILFRQLNIGAYGIADIVGVDTIRDDNGDIEALGVYVYELKKDEVGIDALAQVCRYASGLAHIFEKENIFGRLRVIFFPVLIGKSIDLNKQFVYLARQISNLRIYTYSIGFDGVFFKDIDPENYSPSSLPTVGFGMVGKMSIEDWLSGTCPKYVNN